MILKIEYYLLFTCVFYLFQNKNYAVFLVSVYYAIQVTSPFRSRSGCFCRDAAIQFVGVRGWGSN